MAETKKMYELIQEGNNIHKIRELNTFYNSQRIIKDITNNKYTKSQLIDLLKRTGKAQRESVYKNKDFDTLFNATFVKWELSSNIINGEKSLMDNLEVWQKRIVEELRKEESAKKVIFTDRKDYNEVVISVDNPSTRLTYEYSKILSKVRDEENINFMFCILNDDTINDEHGIEVRLK